MQKSNYPRLLPLTLLAALGACALEGEEEFEALGVADSSGKADAFVGKQVLATYVDPPLEIKTADGRASGKARVLTATPEAVRLRLHPTYVYPEALKKITKVSVTTTKTGAQLGLVAMFVSPNSPDSTQIACKNAKAEGGIFGSLTFDPATKTIDAGDAATFTFAECGLGYVDPTDMAIAVMAVPLPGAASYVGEYPFTVVVDNLEN